MPSHAETQISLYEHQRTALSLLRLHDGFALYMEMGTGKTFPVLFRLAELAASGRINNALIVAPKAVCTSWKEKMTMLDEFQRDDLNRIDLLVVSYDFFWRQEEIMNTQWDAVVLDESHYIKSPSAKRTKGALRVCANAKYRYVLTGTPTSNGQLCNLWSQFAAIDPVVVSGRVYPQCFGGDSYYEWIKRVAYLDQWHKPYKYRNVDEIQGVMAEHSYRITKDECLDLPEKLPDEILHVHLGSKASRYYKQMAKSSAIVELDALAQNALTRSLRLRQLASGFIDEGEEHYEFEDTKLTALKEFLTGFERKVVIFAEFRRSIDSISTMLDDMGLKHVILDGRSKDKGIWKEFQDDEETRVIVVQSASGSAGIDLFAADTCVFYEIPLSSTTHQQARDRIHRPGQTRACSYVYILADGTIDHAIYKALANYRDFDQALFTKFIQEYVKGGQV